MITHLKNKWNRRITTRKPIERYPHRLHMLFIWFGIAMVVVCMECIFFPDYTIGNLLFNFIWMVLMLTVILTGIKLVISITSMFKVTNKEVLEDIIFEENK